jgi:uncharacterized SAM-binding protein YcdF (DUF218 family)
MEGAERVSGSRVRAAQPASGRKRAQGRSVGHARRGAAQGKRRGRVSWKVRAVLLGLLIVVGLVAWGYLARRFAPRGNTDRTHFDAIIVLGDPADDNGNPTPIEQARVSEGVREYERGAAEHMIFTGGAVHNQYVEAEVMARTAEAEGVPAGAVVVEPRARNTIENACYAVRLMKARGWDSAEVVSSGSQLGRAGLIFSRMPIAWRTHAAPAVGPEPAGDAETRAAIETLKTVRYLVWARPMDRCEP